MQKKFKLEFETENIEIFDNYYENKNLGKEIYIRIKNAEFSAEVNRKDVVKLVENLNKWLEINAETENT